MKSLKAIQTLASIGKIISKIIFVFCIVGFCLCIAGIISLAIGPDTLKLGGVSIHSMIVDQTGISTAAMYTGLAVIAFFCAVEAVLCKMAEKYFKNELADGDPFTMRGAKELLRLGVFATVLPLASEVLSSIVVSAVGKFYPDVKDLSLTGFASVGLGIMLIVLALFCRYGSELRDSAGTSPAVPEEVTDGNDRQ